ncbi:FAD-dependent oxidoreductase [Paludibaculum fermentans]|uniref:FAD-dependent oxidoreductase n=1 Tax=Paludibaculum fermentans TaxID=1473598 RepID=A0A7S7SMA3_PALFE|nr:FAD-dependent oxidoreductase [Paludibaculum fermentans]QOY91042.1 FAD-dependent oxidoreductase [Paludibaculum fermentans]
MKKTLLRRGFAALLAPLLALTAISCSGTGPETDILIYGATSGGLAAAIQARRMGKTVVVLDPGTHIGGLTTGGLSWTDIGNKIVVGGIAREFYQRIKKKYEDPKVWTSETRDEYFERRKGPNAKNEDAMWTFEPKVARALYSEMLAEAGVKVIQKARLDLSPGKGVVKENGRIKAIVLEGGTRYEAKMFIDATYEGDLMGMAGVSYAIGRENNSDYKETWNGSQPNHFHYHQFPEGANVDPYVVKGKPESGLLPIIDPTGPGEEGKGDKRIQAYCYRMCLTNDPKNRLPIEKPAGYDEKDHELLLRFAETGKYHEPSSKYDPIPNMKTDTNNHGAVSTDYMGADWSYPEAGYAEREKINKRHEVYQKGYMWTLQNSPRVPAKLREYYKQWGLPKDEFTENGGWPTQLYIREARRMIGALVMTEHHVMAREIVEDSVGMGAYGMDSHNVQRYVTKAGFVRNEGNVQVGGFPPYPVGYRAITPKKDQASNLLVPVALSATHIAYGSIRMEPVFMVLGQSAATAAALAIDANQAVQDVPYPKLRERLLADKQVLEAPAALSKGDIDPRQLEGTVIDSQFAELTPAWKGSRAHKPTLGPSYFDDMDARDGKARAQFTVKMEKAGRYRVKLLYPPFAKQATNVPVQISGGGKTYQATVNQRQPADWLGTYDLPAEFTVTVTNQGTNGAVAVDGLQIAPAQ